MNDLMLAMYHAGRGGMFFFVFLIVAVIVLAFAVTLNDSKK